MAGFTPNEGESAIAELIYNGQALQIGLFTNAIGSLVETSALAAITEPTSAGGYARQTLTAGAWSVTNGQATHPQLSFTATGAAFSAAINGYFIATTGASPILLHVEEDVENSPISLLDGQSYRANLQNQVS